MTGPTWPLYTCVAALKLRMSNVYRFSSSQAANNTGGCIGLKESWLGRILSVVRDVGEFERRSKSVIDRSEPEAARTEVSDWLNCTLSRWSPE